MFCFECTTTDEVLQIVSSYKMKCSPEDPIPALILKENLDFSVPVWTKLVNLSLSQGSIGCLKSAILIPLIKDFDARINKENLNNYRPVSSLHFLAKLIERVVSIRLNKHMSENSLHVDFQYGYKKGHSTETLLLQVINNLLVNSDNNLPSVLMLLDLSAAFDTVDQGKLLEILRDEIGVRGVALSWFESFLIGRTQKVKIGEAFSDISNLKYGVPQGSVLGPALFNIYIRSFRKKVEPAKFELFGFADDHQLLKCFLPIFQVTSLGDDIRRCFGLISSWMRGFFLCLIYIHRCTTEQAGYKQ